MLLSVTLWCLFGGCYLFALETPRGSAQLIRDCCSVNSPLTSSGWASFVLAPSSNVCVTDSPVGAFNGITVCCAPHKVATSGAVGDWEGGCKCLQKQRERERLRQWERCSRKDSLFSACVQHRANRDDNVNDPVVTLNSKWPVGTDLSHDAVLFSMNEGWGQNKTYWALTLFLWIMRKSHNLVRMFCIVLPLLLLISF